MPKKAHLTIYNAADEHAHFHIKDAALELDGQYALDCLAGLRVMHLGSLVDVGAKLAEHSSEIAQNAADIASNHAAVNSSIGTLQTDLSTETAQRTASITAETQARVAGLAGLTGALAAESQARADAIAALQTTTGDTDTALAAETSARTAAIASLESQIGFIQSNVDPAAVDSITELLAAVNSGDNGLLSQITALTTRMTDVEAIVDSLTTAP